MRSRRHAVSWSLRLKAGVYRFRESLFLLPAVLASLGILLTFVTMRLDASWPEAGRVAPLLSMSSNAATWLLSTVAGAMITTAGVVLSLTVVSLQLASDQFSPRVMRSFIRDRMSQSVIGLLVASFFFCVLTLPQLDPEPTAPAPAISLTTAVLLTVITVIAIIAHLDNLARRLQVGHVVQTISDEAVSIIQANQRVPRGARASREKARPPVNAQVIPAQRSGWVSAVDLDALLKQTPPGVTVRLETRIGAYIHQDEALFTAWPDVSIETRKQLASAVAIGDIRTMQQDVDFAIRQLVDIGLRALSAAINDPTTAIEVVMRLGTMLRQLLVTPLGPDVLTDDRRRVIARPWELNYDEYVAHAFDQLRQTAVGQPAVAAALLRVLRMLILHVQSNGHTASVPQLQTQMRRLLESAQDAHWHPADLEHLASLMSDDTDPADHSRDISSSAVDTA